MEKDRFPFDSDWDDGCYGTGCTEPPKSHGVLVTVLLVAVIFLGGIVTALSILNIRMFQELNRKKDKDLAISFALEETQPIRLQEEMNRSEKASDDNAGAASSQGAASNNKYQLLLRSLHSGEIYKTQRTVIVIGNVEEGAALTTLRDAIVLGSIRGVVRAGEEGKGRHFVASSDLRPKKLSIDGVVYRTKAKLFSKPVPGIAAVKDNEIRMVAFDQDMEALFRSDET